MEDGFVTLTFAVQSGVGYLLQYTEAALDESAVWVTLRAFEESAETRTETVSEPLPPGPSQRYYRLAALEE